MEHTYSLQKYAGINSRHTCPHCGSKHSFTLYVDEQGQPLHPTVGRCDHESSCGYHYTPGQFFKDHPEARPGSEDWRKAPEWLSKTVHQRPPVHPCGQVDKVDTIPGDIVSRSVRPSYPSHLIQYLSQILDPVVLESLIIDYRVGVTRSRDTIFFQIDVQGRCRTGKIIKYDPETGHRIKDQDTKGRITWVHSQMKYVGMLPESWTLTQCLFGEHLLPMYPDKPVALVESEKTAIICAGIMPKYLWLATGGKSQLNERLNVLRGRKITAFPDIDGYDTWRAKLAEFPELKVTLCDLLQKYGTYEDRENHIDIADWLLRWQHDPNPAASLTFAAVSQYFSPEVHDELKALIADLDLEFMDVEIIEEL